MNNNLRKNFHTKLAHVLYCLSKQAFFLIFYMFDWKFAHVLYCLIQISVLFKFLCLLIWWKPQVSRTGAKMSTTLGKELQWQLVKIMSCFVSSSVLTCLYLYVTFFGLYSQCSDLGLFLLIAVRYCNMFALLFPTQMVWLNKQTKQIHGQPSTYLVCTLSRHTTTVDAYVRK